MPQVMMLVPSVDGIMLIGPGEREMDKHLETLLRHMRLRE